MKWKSKNLIGVTGWILLAICVFSSEMVFITLVSMKIIVIDSLLFYCIVLAGVGLVGSLLAALLAGSLHRQGKKQMQQYR